MSWGLRGSSISCGGDEDLNDLDGSGYGEEDGTVRWRLMV